MPHADFVHLRVHSAYSLSEGAIRIKDLVALCRDMRMPAVAVTDTNNLFGALEFSPAAKDAGVQPIVGCQLALAREDGGRSANRASEPTADPIVLLVQNAEGYHNLLKLLGRAHFGDGRGEPPVEPHVSLADLEAFGAGLIALTGGALGPVGRLLAEGQGAAAEAVLTRLARTFPGRLYIELQRHGLPVERQTEPGLIDLAYRLDLPLVATNEAFFPGPGMFEAHDALICIAEGALLSQDDRRHLTPEHYLKSPDAMRAQFADLPEAVDNTLVIARRCAFMVEKVKPILPPFPCANGLSEADELKHQAEAGLEARLVRYVFKPDMSAETRAAAAKPYRERLAYELEVIAKMGFPGYFLIVADFIRWAKAQGIPVGPGRGSGAGSVVSWALTITDLDPLRFGLLFERFLNPERVSMPDFDIDFCQDRRDEVIHYVQEKYGRDRVAQIITFGKLQARAVLRDVGRVMELPYGYVDKICKLVPNNPAKPVTLGQAIEGEPALRKMIEDDEAVARLVNVAEQLEGLYRHASTHAAGVVIGDRPLDTLIPLARDPRSNKPVTGFNMKYVESAGLVKFDFLGLKTLTVLEDAARLVRDSGTAIDLSHLPLDDPATFNMLEKGDTTGVFQLESAGMRDVLKNLKSDCFEDIIAVVALYRPGPMANIPSYIKRKHGEEQPDYLYPTLEGILKETFGIMIYQEQVMQIAQELSGYTLGNADLLRRAMGKKIKSEMDQQRAVFVEGAKNRGVPEARAVEIFDLVAKFADYGFNKSHAAAYALVAYQTAYMKANHPVEFLAASMTHDTGNTDKLNVFRQELDRLGIALLPPDINASGAHFTVETTVKGKAIRYALAAIKNVGAAAMASVVAERQKGGAFQSLADFVRRLDPRVVNKRQLENLAKAGAFDRLNGNRRQVFEGAEALLRHANVAANERASSQISLFGGEARPALGLPLPEVADWPPMDRLHQEFEAVGFYLSAHPLDAYRKSLQRLQVRTINEVMGETQSGIVRLAGTVIGKKERTSAKGSRYAFVQLSDSSGVFEVTIFSEVLAASRGWLEVGQSVYVKANAQFEGDTARLTAQAVEPLDEVAARAVAGMVVYVDAPEALSPLRDILLREKTAKANGNGRKKGAVQLVSRLGEEEVTIDLGGYPLSPAVYLAVKAVPGVRDVRET
jgi:DNA polymerase-3 subunit alpha